MSKSKMIWHVVDEQSPPEGYVLAYGRLVGRVVVRAYIDDFGHESWVDAAGDEWAVFGDGEITHYAALLEPPEDAR